MISPDAVIAPWLEIIRPSHLWIVGSEVPPVARDYQKHSQSTIQLLSAQAINSETLIPTAALCIQPIAHPDDLVTLGQLRNLLIPNIFCLVAANMPANNLFGLAFKRGSFCRNKTQQLLSFHYALATYNHTRSWNNPKSWANPENWNKFWW